MFMVMWGVRFSVSLLTVVNGFGTQCLGRFVVISECECMYLLGLRGLDGYVLLSVSFSYLASK